MNAETVVPVEIVCPKMTAAKWLHDTFAHLFSLAISSWIVMLLAPEFYKPVGYWYALGFVFLVRNVLGDQSSHMLWTRERKS